ncbi:hypothetical protein GORBP_036_00210 [Gordonia rubripertincta NBRC 101908]|uniref:Uncharacterized protein n=1 Tax=Gordonia rubripertincta NBRC 101908 TaxID=1077975 RepID=A0ABQ0HPN8_GORRU|nr:hypothetical protein GORBP_036_00210 [Gordonia rubripertincta NBRC 101908]
MVLGFVSRSLAAGEQELTITINNAAVTTATNPLDEDTFRIKSQNTVNPSHNDTHPQPDEDSEKPADSILPSEKPP